MAPHAAPTRDAADQTAS